MMGKRNNTGLPDWFEAEAHKAKGDVLAREYGTASWIPVRILAGLSACCLCLAIATILASSEFAGWVQPAAYIGGVLFGCAAIACHQLPALKVRKKPGKRSD